MVATDSRELGDGLRDGARAPSPALREAAALGLARLHDPAALPLLRALMRDPVPLVRDAAALGLGAFEEDAPAGVGAALLASLAAETDVGLRGERLWDLGRVGGDAAWPVLERSLSAVDPRERAGSCLGVGAEGLAGHAPPGTVVAAAADLAAVDPDVEVRRACAYAVGRSHGELGEGDASKVAAALEDAVGDPDEDVRALALRAMGARHLGATEAVQQACGDPSYRVAVAAFRTLAQRSTPESHGPYVATLDGVVRTARAHRPLAAPRDLPLLVGLEEAQALGPAPSVMPVAERLLATLASRHGPSRLEGLVHCRASVLVDLGHGWPARTTTCGLGVVDEADRDEATLAVLAHLPAELGARRADYVTRVYDHGGPRTREAALTTAAAIADPAADVLLQRGLANDDVGVVSAALEALPPAAARVRPEGAPLTLRLRRALEHAETLLAATDEVEGLGAWLDAVAALHVTELRALVRTLAAHPCRAVRDRAAAALHALGAAPSQAPPALPSNVIPPADLPAPEARPVATLELAGGGTVEIALLTAEAPTTVARFVSLARRGFFDGLGFHRVVPGFVAQGGDPRGDGFGGPGFTQRCEDGRTRYERGVVGMALAGRDTGGSQFFVTTGAAYHLDGRYTAFGRVTRGMDAVDALLPGDRIRTVRITEATAR